MLSTLDKFKVEICQYIDSKMDRLDELSVSIKSDDSPVTKIDIFISDLFKKKFLNLYPFLNFYSEEDLGEFNYPLVIIDPIDGTRELSKGIGECAVSFGIYYSSDFSDERNFSWIFNPFNLISVDSYSLDIKSRYKQSNKLLTFVSQTEFDKGLYNDVVEDFIVIPKGSIAYKLCLLSKGICDLVVTRKPKNIWDIMAGSHICSKLGMSMFVNGKRTTSLETILIEGPMIWCRVENEEKALTLFQK